MTVVIAWGHEGASGSRGTPGGNTFIMPTVYISLISTRGVDRLSYIPAIHIPSGCNATHYEPGRKLHFYAQLSAKTNFIVLPRE